MTQVFLFKIKEYKGRAASFFVVFGNEFEKIYPNILQIFYMIAELDFLGEKS